MEARQEYTTDRCNVLVVEDNEADFELARHELSFDVGSHLKANKIEWCRSVEEAVLALREQVFDIVLLDYSLPDSVGLSGLLKLKDQYPHLPVVFYTEMDNEEIALSALKSGAQDFVIKSKNSGSLLRTVRYALERNHIELQLRVAQENADSANRAKSAFLANMSHEIRTPLTAILGFTEISLDHSISGSQREALLSIKRNCEHLNQLINNVLDISKIESNRIELRPTNFSLFHFIDDISLIFKSKASEKGIVFDFDYKFPLPSSIMNDELYLKQVLTNIISNAIKFTDKGGVTVAISYDQSLNLLIFKISDTGIGMSDDFRTRMFRPFTQEDSSITRTYGGTGLGLSISKRLAEMLGGSLQYETEKGRGTTFTISVSVGNKNKLSLVNQRPPRRDEFTYIAKAQRKKIKGRVLLVDDMPDNRALMKHFLKDVGASVALAEDGVMAVSLAQKQDFDLILLDMQMPILDGYECARQLRALNIKCPIIAVTASAISGAEELCLQAGCTGYLRKPFTRDQLLHIVYELLPEDKSSSDLVKIDKYSQIDEELLPITLGFIKNLPDRILALQQSYASNNHEELRQHAHKLAGAEMFGFEELGNVSHTLEHHIKIGKTEQIAELMKRIVFLAKEACELESRIRTQTNDSEGKN